MMTVYLVAADRLGRGDDELGVTLMANFLRKLWAAPRKPDTIVLCNGGVRLLAPGGAALDALSGLAAAGVDLVTCGTCVAFFGLNDLLQVGRISNMEEIVAIVASADKVVTL